MLSAPQDHPVEAPREPIFKLAWSGFPNSSDPRGGNTVLTVLGGMTIDASPGVTALLFPPLQPPAPPNPTSPKPAGVPDLHPHTRAAMCGSLVVKDIYTYVTAGPVQDFLLFPRSNPHFSGHYDPSAIVVTSDSDVPEARVTEAFEFPPPTFVSPPGSPGIVASSGDTQDAEGAGAADALAKELAMTMQAMSMSDEARLARLPPCLWSVLGEYLVKVDKHTYDTLVQDKLVPINGEIPLPIKGGLAWSEDPDGIMKLIKVNSIGPVSGLPSVLIAQ